MKDDLEPAPANTFEALQGSAGGGSLPLPPPDKGARGRIVRLGIMVVILILLAVYVWRNWADFQKLGQSSLLTLSGLWALAGVVLLDLACYYWNAGMIQIATRPFGVRVRAGEAYMLSVLTRFLNYLTPLRGGAIARALYLNRVHKLSYPNFLAGMAGMLLALPLVSVLVGLAGLGYMYLATGQAVPWLTVVLAVAAVPLVAVAIVRPRLSERTSPGWTSRVWNALARVVNGWDVLCRDRRSLAGLLVVNLLYVLTTAAMYWLILVNMGQPINPGQLMVIVAMGNLSVIVSITPGNVGVYEGTTAIIGSLIGVGGPVIAATTLLWRVLDFLLALVTGPPCSAALTRRVSD
jgi:uncharacterized protein (TIRG00374 family)